MSVSLTADLPPHLARTVTADLDIASGEISLIRVTEVNLILSRYEVTEVRARVRVAYTPKGTPRIVPVYGGGEYGRVIPKQQQAHVERQLIAALRRRGMIARR